MARRTNRKKGSGGGFVLTLILVLLAIAVAGGIYYAASRDGEKDVLDKGLTGSSSVDLREESKKRIGQSMIFYYRRITGS